MVFNEIFSRAPPPVPLVRSKIMKIPEHVSSASKRISNANADQRFESHIAKQMDATDAKNFSVASVTSEI